jgi:hypothetical protein
MRHDDPPDPNKKCDKSKDDDDQPPVKYKLEPIPPIVSEGPCEAWELADAWTLGFGFGAEAVLGPFGTPFHLLEALSAWEHHEFCTPLYTPPKDLQ